MVDLIPIARPTWTIRNYASPMKFKPEVEIDFTAVSQMSVRQVVQALPVLAAELADLAKDGAKISEPAFLYSFLHRSVAFAKENRAGTAANSNRLVNFRSKITIDMDAASELTRRELTGAIPSLATELADLLNGGAKPYQPAYLYGWLARSVAAAKKSRSKHKSVSTDAGSLAEEFANPHELPEGARKTIVVNAYERDPTARNRCIQKWGAVCSACGFDFAHRYGELGDGFIHVHHLVPLSSIAAEYQLNPERDLRPVCPNCHAMLHRHNPPLTIEQLAEVLRSHTS